MTNTLDLVVSSHTPPTKKLYVFCKYCKDYVLSNKKNDKEVKQCVKCKKSIKNFHFYEVYEK